VKNALTFWNGNLRELVALPQGFGCTSSHRERLFICFSKLQSSGALERAVAESGRVPQSKTQASHIWSLYFTLFCPNLWAMQKRSKLRNETNFLCKFMPFCGNEFSNFMMIQTYW
jgi:hypothetical protein